MIARRRRPDAPDDRPEDPQRSPKIPARSPEDPPEIASTCSSVNSFGMTHIFAIHELCASFLVALHSLSNSYRAVWEECGRALPRLVPLRIALECPTSSPSTSYVLAFWWLCIRSLVATQQCGKRAGRALPRLVDLQIAAECATCSPSTSSVFAL